MLQDMREHDHDHFPQTLACVDSVVALQREKLRHIRHPAAAEEVKKAVTDIETIEAYLSAYTQLYPSKTPLRIDNGHLRTGNFDTVPPATLIAYCLALTSRIFHRTSRPGANFILKCAKLYATSIAVLGGGINILQRRALDATPEDYASAAAAPTSRAMFRRPISLDILDYAAR
ncbi:hypothetical protein GGG16DRAFT_119943 [Schizophyllum commune]